MPNHNLLERVYQQFQVETRLYNNFYFVGWLRKRDGSLSFQFRDHKGNRKSIPQRLFILAEQQRLLEVDADWFNQNTTWRGADCRRYVFNHLLPQFNGIIS